MWFHFSASECDCSSCLFAAKEEAEAGGGVCVFLDFFAFFHLVAFWGVRGRQCQLQSSETLLLLSVDFLLCVVC